MPSIVSQEIRLKSLPQGLPDGGNFELATVDGPPLGEGDVLVRNIWMSVDPYMRGRLTDRASYIPPFKIGGAMEGGAIWQVVGSKAPGLAVGDHVASMLGWRDYAVGREGNFQKIDPSLAP